MWKTLQPKDSFCINQNFTLGKFGCLGTCPRWLVLPASGLIGDLNFYHLGQGSAWRSQLELALSPGPHLGPLMCRQKMLSSLWFSLFGKKNIFPNFLSRCLKFHRLNHTFLAIQSQKTVERIHSNNLLLKLLCFGVKCEWNQGWDVCDARLTKYCHQLLRSIWSVIWA